MSLSKGTTLGPYEILSKLGEGGMGAVYLAKDPRLERNVAIKTLPEEFSQRPEALMRFQAENKAVAALSHPNIRIIYDIGVDKGYTFAVMELLEGETLASRLQRSALDWHEAVQVALGVASGLAAAHNKGIIHRDIKPHNIFLTDSGETKILDFGLALSFAGISDEESETMDSTMTLDDLAGKVSGTIPYMSPEQVRNKPADNRSDIFSYGCVLYEMLTTKRLFARDSAPEIMVAVLYETPPNLSKSGIVVPAELQRLVNLCLEKAPNHRIQSMNDIIDVLKKVQKSPISPKKGYQEASVAVLPFVNMSKDSEDEYFSDGLTEELIDSLVKIGGLQVASHTTSAVYKGKSHDIRFIAEQLHVRTVVEGSVRRAGNRFRISAQLINAEDGYHLWSDRYDRDVDDVFAVQSEIAHKIAEALQVVLTEKEKRAIAKAPTDNIQAYETYLQGRHNFYMFQRDSFKQALSLFLHASKLDPEFAGSYAWASYCYSFLYSWFDASEVNLTEADANSRKALALNPKLAEAHVAKGMALSLKKQIQMAKKEFETAIRLKPDLYEASYFYARNCFSQGKYELAAQLAEQASSQRPDDYNASYLLGMIYNHLGQKKEARKAFSLSLERAEKTLEIFPDDTRALSFGAGALNHLDKKQQALDWAERAFQNAPEEPMTLYAVACNFAMLGRPDKAISCLERARLFGSLPKKWLENDPDLDSLRKRPRFQAFLKQLKEE
jgi:non-specific serine/threonine protein kinase